MKGRKPRVSYVWQGPRGSFPCTCPRDHRTVGGAFGCPAIKCPGGSLVLYRYETIPGGFPHLIPLNREEAATYRSLYRTHNPTPRSPGAAPR